MGKMSGKPGPDPRSRIQQVSLSPFGGPHRPPLEELTDRQEDAYEQALEDLGELEDLSGGE
jgi:hypothetical protein